MAGQPCDPPIGEINVALQDSGCSWSDRLAILPMEASSSPSLVVRVE
jgi:hypothetical protein